MTLLNQLNTKMRVNGKPLFLQDKDSSCIRIMHKSEVARESTANLLRIFQKQHVVIIGDPPGPRNFRHALRGVGSNSKVRTIQGT